MMWIRAALHKQIYNKILTILIAKNNIMRIVQLVNFTFNYLCVCYVFVFVFFLHSLQLSRALVLEPPPKGQGLKPNPEPPSCEARRLSTAPTFVKLFLIQF